MLLEMMKDYDLFYDDPDPSRRPHDARAPQLVAALAGSTPRGRC